MSNNNYLYIKLILKKIMKKSILTLTLLCVTITTLVAQDAEPSKNKFGALLSTNIFGFNDDFNKVDVGGGFYFSRKISKKLSIYTEMDGSSRTDSFDKIGNLSSTDASGKKMEMDLVTIPSLKIANAEFQDLSFRLIDEFDFQCTDGIVGIIGYSAMRHANWQVDYEYQKLIL